MNLLGDMVAGGYEEVAFGGDAATGLRAIIAIHDTTLGPALGGARYYPYESEAAALTDVLRLSRAMTYKSAAAGIDFGGGKAVIIGAPGGAGDEAKLRAFGRFVDTLGGRYITTEDVGIRWPQDLEAIRGETKHVVGLPVAAGGSGDTSPLTGYGVYRALQACAGAAWGSEELGGRRVAVQGAGHVGWHLMAFLRDAGARITVSDLSAARLEQARQEFGAETVPSDAMYDLECDVFAPCALGGVLNERTIPRLRCIVVCGGANNQLLDEAQDAARLAARGILYGPDFIANAGGVINISCEVGGSYSEAAARRKADGIFATMGQVIATAEREGITPHDAARRVAAARIAAQRG